MKNFVLVLLGLATACSAATPTCRDTATGKRFCSKYKDLCKSNDYIENRCRKTCGSCATVVVPTPTSSTHECSDKYRNCPTFWKNYCTQPVYDPITKVNCEKTCGWCGDGGTGILPDQKTCGMQKVQLSRVIGGDNAKRGAWPWQILMLKHGRPICGGTLIGDRWVVTAAHCIDGSEHKPTYFKVRVGENDQKVHEGSEMEIQVEQVIKHPKYNRRTIQNDIALFKLAKPAMLGPYVQPACLPTLDPSPGSECYITGWGKIKHPGSMHFYLQQTVLPVVSNDVCEKFNYKNTRIRVTKDMICGGDGGMSNKSGCHGDSGGPFVCKVNGKWELHGDVSYGDSTCNSRKSYTVFARTKFFRAWIEQQIKRFG